MGEPGAGTEQVPEALAAPGAAGGPDPEDLRDWAGLPEDLLVTVARTLVAQTEAGWAAHLKENTTLNEEEIQEVMAWRERNGNCLFVFAMVCKPWRKAQLKVGGPLRTRVKSDVIMPGQVALVKWALAEGCPREDGNFLTIAHYAAEYGHFELVRWLIREQGFAMGVLMMMWAAGSGNLELIQWLRGEGCPWDANTCYTAVLYGGVEVLGWVRENGCEWEASTRDRAAEKLGYTDDLGNLV